MSDAKKRDVPLSDSNQEVQLPTRKSEFVVTRTAAAEDNQSLTCYEFRDYDNSKFVYVDDPDRFVVGDTLVMVKK